MEQRVSDYQTAADNFWELTRVSKPVRSKVILTCRTTYFKDELEEKQVLTRDAEANIIGNERVIAVGGDSPYKVVSLMELSQEEMKAILRKRLGQDMQSVWQAIKRSPELSDLARRPALIDMLIRVISEMSLQSDINLAKLFELYIQKSLKKYETDIFDMSFEDRVLFLEELAWEMYVARRLSINWSDFPARVKDHFRLNHSPQSALFFERALRTQSYLTRDKHGNYSFAHKSFMEFFVAKKIYKLLIEYQIDENVLASQIGDFSTLFGQKPFTSEVRNFLKQLIQEDST